MATRYELLLPEVLLECPGVPTPSALISIRNAVRYFCEESTAWRYDLPVMSTVTDEIDKGEYKLVLPEYSQIVSVLPPVIHNGLSVVNKTKTWLERNEVKWRDMVAVQAIYYTMITTDILRLVPYQKIAVSDNLLVSVALKPTRDAIEIDDYIYNEYADDIINIAKSMLMLMPDVKWSNPKLGTYYKSMGETAIKDAFSKSTSGYSKGKTDRNNKVMGHFF